jgi:hypothetical protein
MYILRPRRRDVDSGSVFAIAVYITMPPRHGTRLTLNERRLPTRRRGRARRWPRDA